MRNGVAIGGRGLAKPRAESRSWCCNTISTITRVCYGNVTDPSQGLG